MENSPPNTPHSSKLMDKISADLINPKRNIQITTSQVLSAMKKMAQLQNKTSGTLIGKEVSLSPYTGGHTFIPKEPHFKKPTVSPRRLSTPYIARPMGFIPKMEMMPESWVMRGFQETFAPQVLSKVKNITPLIRASRFVSLAARATLIGVIVGSIMDVAAEKILKETAKQSLRKSAAQYKKIARIGIQQIHGHLNQTLNQTANNIRLNATVDTSNYDRALKEYIKNSKRDIADIVNQKAYWIGINAIKETYKANKQTIQADLNKPSDVMNGLTVAEAIVVDRRRVSGERRLTRGELKKEARTLINKRIRAIGFLKSGWIPGVQVLAPLVQKKLSVGTQKMSRGEKKGGAIGASRLSNTNRHVASIWSDIYANNNPKAEAYMREGLQRGLDIEARSMMAYVETKMRKNAEKFNRS